MHAHRLGLQHHVPGGVGQRDLAGDHRRPAQLQVGAPDPRREAGRLGKRRDQLLPHPALHLQRPRPNQGQTDPEHGKECDYYRACAPGRAASWLSHRVRRHTQVRQPRQTPHSTRAVPRATHPPRGVPSILPRAFRLMFKYSPILARSIRPGVPQAMPEMRCALSRRHPRLSDRRRAADHAQRSVHRHASSRAAT